MNGDQCTKESHGVRTVLVVDDDAELQASTCRILGLHYPVLSATSGEDALRVARSARPSVIVLDVMMPGGKDGFAVFRELQNDPSTQDIPVIFLTNINRLSELPFGAGELEKYMGKKPVAFLEKPVAFGELLRCVAEALDAGARGELPTGNGR